MVTTNEIRNWKKKADAGDAESAFIIYTTHTDPATGAPQDWDVAWHYLNIAFESGHPDAINMMGILYIEGLQIEKDVPRGIELLKKSKALGCQIADYTATMLGIDLNDSASTASGGSNVGKIVLLIKERLDELMANGIIDRNQKEAILLLVNDASRSGDELAMNNLYGILHNEKELKKLATSAGRIVGWDSESMTYYVKPQPIVSAKTLWITFGIISLVYVCTIFLQR